MGRAAAARDLARTLADVYRSSGQDDEARQVNIAANADRRRWGALKPGAWWANALFDVTIKFGYKSWRAVAGLLAVYILAVIAFTIGQSQPGLIIPTASTTGISPAPTASRCSKGYPCFYPAGFAIDVVVPIVNVHQADEWGTGRGHRLGMGMGRRDVDRHRPRLGLCHPLRRGIYRLGPLGLTFFLPDDPAESHGNLTACVQAEDGRPGERGLQAVNPGGPGLWIAGHDW